MSPLKYQNSFQKEFTVYDNFTEKFVIATEEYYPCNNIRKLAEGDIYHEKIKKDHLQMVHLPKYIFFLKATAPPCCFDNEGCLEERSLLHFHLKEKLSFSITGYAFLLLLCCGTRSRLIKYVSLQDKKLLWERGG